MPDLFPWFMLAHILGAIVAFGPSFAFPLIGGMGGREPMYANFATRVSLRIEERIVVPLAIVQGITGIGLIWTGSVDLFAEAWLVVSIVLYLAALGFAIFVQTKAIERVVELSSAPMPAPAAGDAPAGPPPVLLAAIKRVQLGGMYLTVSIVAIVFLMVVKPF